MSIQHAELVERCSSLMRENSSHVLVLHQVIAESLGLGPTDVKCLDLARGEADLTASRVAELTGLSTSAVTALLDRLERAGFVRRERDTGDRRRIFVRPTGKQTQRVNDAFAPLATATTEILAGCTAEQLTFLADFLDRLNVAARSLTQKQK